MRVKKYTWCTFCWLTQDPLTTTPPHSLPLQLETSCPGHNVFQSLLQLDVTMGPVSSNRVIHRNAICNYVYDGLCFPPRAWNMEATPSHLGP